VDHVPDLTSTPVQIRRYRTDPAMEGRVTTLPTEAVSYVVMKLAVPPFDDVHVRRAVAFAIDRAEILEVLASDPQVASWFGTAQPVAATHIAPDALEGNLLATYEPYPPNLSRARQEMAQSSYDTDGDGRCDAPECREVLALAREDSFGSDASDAVAARLAAIGIGVRVEMASATRFYRRLNSEAEKGALGFGADFAAEYPNASTFLPPMFSSAFIGSWNWSLVGATSAQLTRAGYEVTSVPSVDERLDRCATMTGLAQTECWADLDRYLMEQVVPFVPYLTTTETFVVSERVSSSSYSVLSRGLALDRIALEEGSE
jgi:ABC-type transport system substrate-binding protein